MTHINENAKIKNGTFSWDNTSFLRENNFTYHKKKNMFFTNVLLRNIIEKYYLLYLDMNITEKNHKTKCVVRLSFFFGVLYIVFVPHSKKNSNIRDDSGGSVKKISLKQLRRLLLFLFG